MTKGLNDSVQRIDSGIEYVGEMFASSCQHPKRGGHPSVLIN